VGLISNCSAVGDVVIIFFTHAASSTAAVVILTASSRLLSSKVKHTNLSNLVHNILKQMRFITQMTTTVNGLTETHSNHVVYTFKQQQLGYR